MHFKTVALLALSAMALAHPKRWHSHHFHGTGSRAILAPTGGPPNSVNEPENPSTPIETATSGEVYTAIPVFASSVDAPNALVSSEVNTTSSSTTTVTSTAFMTVTVDPEETAAPTLANSTSADVSLPTDVSVAAGQFFQASSSPHGGPRLSTSTSSSTTHSTAASITSKTSTSTSTSSVAVSTSKTSSSSSSTIKSATSSLATSSAAAVSSKTSSASSTPTSTTISSSSSGRRGLPYNDPSLTNAFSGTSMSWAYNWGSTPGGSVASGLEYVPMLWGTSDQKTATWSQDATNAIASGSKHLLSFNEPDLSSQSNIDPATAAAGHIKWMNPFSGQAKIGSPAVTNGGSPMGATYLQSFFDACAGQCKVDFVTFHWYDSASNLAYFKSHVQDIINVAANNSVSKVWLTEFGASGSDSDVVNFFSQALPWLDSQPAVERYSYFMCSNGLLVNGTSMSTTGKAYAA